PQPRPAPTARALPPKPAAQRGPFWMPVGGPNPTPIDTDTLLGAMNLRQSGGGGHWPSKAVPATAGTDPILMPAHPGASPAGVRFGFPTPTTPLSRAACSPLSPGCVRNSIEDPGQENYSRQAA